MRHANPNGDFAPIVERAIDLLLEQLMQRRFGKTRLARREPASSSAARHCATEGPSTRSMDQPVTSQTQPHLASPRTDPPAPQGHMPTPPRASASSPSTGAASPSTAASSPATGASSPRERSASPSPPSDDAAAARRTSKPGSPPTERITNATRRVVAARDGLQCSWVDDHGRRCPSRAWLEHDHRQPRGKGGSSEAHNIRIFCRAHNQLAAEQAYGREHMERFARCEVGTVKPPLTVRDSRQPRWKTHHSSTGSLSPSAPSRSMNGDAARPA
jgi:hypothetical protein